MGKSLVFYAYISTDDWDVCDMVKFSHLQNKRNNWIEYTHDLLWIETKVQSL